MEIDEGGSFEGGGVRLGSEWQVDQVRSAELASRTRWKMEDFDDELVEDCDWVCCCCGFLVKSSVQRYWMSLNDLQEKFEGGLERTRTVDFARRSHMRGERERWCARWDLGDGAGSER